MFAVAVIWRDRNGTPVVVQETNNPEEVSRLFEVLRLRLEVIPLEASPIGEAIRSIERERLEKFMNLYLGA